MPPCAEDRPGAFDRWLPVLVAAALSILPIGRWALWQDEAFSWHVVQKDVAGMIAAAAGDRHPPLYYLVAAPFAHVADRDEWLRLPSALAFVAAVALVRRAGALALGPGAGRAAAWFLALCPFAILFADTARMYGMLLGWGALLLVGSVELALGSAIAGPAAILAVGAAGSIWTHYAGAGAIVGAALGGALGVVARRDLSPRLRAGRILALGGGLAAAGASFLPWATGPLQFQLANKDVPIEPTLGVLAYLGWNFDTRVPALSWASFALQGAGLVLLLRRAGAARWALLGWVAVAVLFPWWMSRSLPAQNPRNAIGFLPIGSLLAGSALCALATAISTRARRPTLAPALAVAPLVALAVEPIHDLLSRPVSPQETGAGFDYQFEAQVMDASTPRNVGLHFRPAYMRTQYARYAEGIAARGTLALDERSVIATARAEWLDPRVSTRFPPECVFQRAFRVVLYSPPGPGCDAMLAWLRAAAEELDYVPARMELAYRARDAGDLGQAEAQAMEAAAHLRAHPTALLFLAETREKRGDFEGALDAAGEAGDVARRWHFPGPSIAEAERVRARVLAALGRADEAKASDATARCARDARYPTFCGTLLSRFAGKSPPGGGPALPPLPALSEPQVAPPPEGAPAGTRRIALWSLDGEVLPSDWIDAAGPGAQARAWMEPAGPGMVLSLSADDRSPVTLVCAPMVPAAERLAVRMRWKLDVRGTTERGRLRLEARMAGEDGKVRAVLGRPVAERPLEVGTTTPWRVDRLDFRAGDAAQVRLCVVAEGPAQVRASVDWIEVLDANPGEGT